MALYVILYTHKERKNKISERRKDMSENEKKSMEKLFMTLSKLDEPKKQYILGLADGMALERESRKEINSREMVGVTV